MNTDLQKLFSIASKQERLIIGLMSGTSMDGLDIALCSCKGFGADTQIKVLEFVTVPYSSEFRQQIKGVFSKRTVDLQEVCLLNELIAIRHSEMVLESLKSWDIPAAEIDLIASHGQTIFHAPQHLHGLENYPNGTLQIGDWDHIAVKTGIITLSDFRQKHLAAG
ncbi:MAG TPA: anhydro-N-acetylmuramic acid kinase, partial [Daejeonella sp.]|nr:anhydro-N-acetylmuramic acid kinase [Daejeonella sp.]